MSVWTSMTRHVGDMATWNYLETTKRRGVCLHTFRYSTQRRDVHLACLRLDEGLRCSKPACWGSPDPRTRGVGALGKGGVFRLGLWCGAGGGHCCGFHCTHNIQNNCWHAQNNLLHRCFSKSALVTQQRSAGEREGSGLIETSDL